MNNRIIIPLSICEHLSEISSYNNNYYKLPDGMKILESDVILEICDEDYDDYSYILGKEKEGRFEDDGDHIRFPSSYGFDILKNNIILELDRKNDYNY